MCSALRVKLSKSSVTTCFQRKCQFSVFLQSNELKNTKHISHYSSCNLPLRKHPDVVHPLSHFIEQLFFSDSKLVNRTPITPNGYICQAD